MTEKEYNECVRNHADSVFRFILKSVRNKEDARDIVQTAFEKMWNNRATIENTTCRSFLFTVAYNQMIDQIRKNKMIMVSEMMAEDKTVFSQHRNHTRKALDLALATLSETQRSLVLLKDYEGYSYEEIGQITGLNASQVKVYLHRARVQLKNYLGSPENILEQ